MKQSCHSIVCVIILSLAFNVWGQEKTDASLRKYIPVTKYDPKRDAETDIKEAVLEAHRTGRRVLVDVGGEWCIWCHILDKFFDQNPELLEYREKNFVMVKVNYSPENKNEKVLSGYGEIPGFPHLIVLDTNGKMLQSQDTSELEAGKSYEKEKMNAFLKRWGPR